jgi:hypothetical protein
VLTGLTRLLTAPLAQTYLPGSQRKVPWAAISLLPDTSIYSFQVHLHQELLIFFWKFCEHNRKFLFYVLKSSDVLELLVPILHHLNDARADQARLGLMHIGVFILLLLSGERNFGVRLNKPYSASIPLDIPVFSGSHGDLLIIVFHRIITSGHSRLQPLFDCLLTILCNVSPYMKSMSITAACKLLHLVEAFSTPWFLVSNPTNHTLVFFLLEMLNNLIQYQFDGNSNLVYTMIRKRSVFHQLAALPSDCSAASLRKKGRPAKPDTEQAMEGSRPARPAEPGTLRATLPSTPCVASLTEGVSAHPSTIQLDRLAGGGPEEAAEVLQQAKQEEAKDSAEGWSPTADWVAGWKARLPLQTVMRMLQVLVPQVERMCLERGMTDEGEILRFLQHGTLVGLLPVPHPILIRRYQANPGTRLWFRTYMWGVLYLRNTDPPVWYETEVKLFQVQRV